MTLAALFSAMTAQKRLAYAAFIGQDCILNLDGQEGKEKFSGFMRNVPIVFDSQKSLHVLATRLPGPMFYRLEVEIEN